MNTDSCEMRTVPDRDAVLAGEAGDFCIETVDNEAGVITYMFCRLPSRGFCMLPLNRSPGWTWDGIRELPTLQPSVFHDPNSGSKFEWHGFIRNGRMESC